MTNVPRKWAMSTVLFKSASGHNDFVMMISFTPVTVICSFIRYNLFGTSTVGKWSAFCLVIYLCIRRVPSPITLLPDTFARMFLCKILPRYRYIVTSLVLFFPAWCLTLLQVMLQWLGSAWRMLLFPSSRTMAFIHGAHQHTNWDTSKVSHN